MENMIGLTPLLKIRYKYKGDERTLYAKQEAFNLTGSIKDRMARHIIEKSYQDGSLKKGMPIVEATSGNTGIAFSALGALYEHPVHIFMPDWMSKERKDIIEGYGAILHEVSEEQGGFEGSVVLADAFAKEVGGFRPQQFYNPYNMDAHFQTTGKEICLQLEKFGIEAADGFVAGVGTGGTIMGVGKRLKERNKDVKLFPVEPVKAPAMSKGVCGGVHRIQGIGDGFIPEMIDMDWMDDVAVVHDGDAVIMAQKLARELGLGVGISSGANFLASVMMHNKYGKDFNLVTVFSDDSKKYLTTGLLQVEPVLEGFMSPDIELISVDGTCVCQDRLRKHECLRKSLIEKNCK